MDDQESVFEDTTRKDTVYKLAMAGNHYAVQVPGLSRFYLSEMSRLLYSHGAPSLQRRGADGEQGEVRETVCPYCGTILLPGNSHIKIVPKPKLTAKKRRRLQQRQGEGGQLEEKYSQRRNSVVIKCGTCGREEILPGSDRNNATKKMKKALKRISHRSTMTPSQKTGHTQSKGRTMAVNEEGPTQDSGFITLLSAAPRSLSLSVISASSSSSLTRANSHEGGNTSLSSGHSVSSSSSSSRLPLTSTPIISRRSRHGPGATVPDGRAASLSTILASPAKTTTKKTKTKPANRPPPAPPGGKKKKKKSHDSVLQRLVNQQRAAESAAKQAGYHQGGGLKEFLTAL